MAQFLQRVRDQHAGDRSAAAVPTLWPVSRAVNNVRNNGAELLNRIDDPQAPPQ